MYYERKQRAKTQKPLPESDPELEKIVEEQQVIIKA
jgi:hypothetical protein